MKANSIFRALSLTVALAVVAAATGCQYILPAEEEPLAPPLVQPKDVVYTTANVERGDVVQSVQGTGRVQSVKMVDLYFEAGGGRLKSLNVKYGDQVKKGDVLLQLDTGELDYQLAVAKLKYQEQQNSYSANKGFMRKADKANAQIEMQIAKMEIEKLEKQKAEATLVSPIDGSVVYVTTTNLGNNVDAYATLVRISDPSVKMLTYDDESNSAAFRVGMKVQVTLNTESGKKTVEGEIVSTPFERNKFDSDKLAKMTFIKVPDEYMAKANVGDEVKVVLILSERKNTLWLPRNAVKTFQQRRYVQVLENNVKVEKNVEVGLETATQTEIINGLAEGDKVIVR